MENDLTLIKKLEEISGEQFREVRHRKIERYFENGYSLDKEQRVIGLYVKSIHRPDIISVVKQFQYLTKLVLYRTGIRDAQFINGFPGLTALSKISDISFLKGVPNLIFLSLADNENITDYSFSLALTVENDGNIVFDNIRNVSISEQLPSAVSRSNVSRWSAYT